MPRRQRQRRRRGVRARAQPLLWLSFVGRFSPASSVNLSVDSMKIPIGRSFKLIAINASFSSESAACVQIRVNQQPSTEPSDGFTWTSGPMQVGNNPRAIRRRFRGQWWPNDTPKTSKVLVIDHICEYKTDTVPVNYIVKVGFQLSSQMYNLACPAGYEALTLCPSSTLSPTNQTTIGDSCDSFADMSVL